jgi:hypothetical protein
MIRNILITYGLGAAWLWWVFAPLSVTVRSTVAIVLVVATIVLFGAVARRSRRLRSTHESISGRLITHVGGGQSRWDHHDDDGIESTVGGGW